MNALREHFEILMKDRLGMIGMVILVSLVLIAIFAPYIAPYDPMESQYRPDGSFARMDPPSREFIFGTTRMGHDVFSQVVIGSRVALIVGIVSAIASTLIGVNVGLISGYYGGRIDNFLMRLTDIVYGVPFLPFVIILVAILGPSLGNTLLAIILISWRTTARVIRSQVLTLKQRVFIEAAKVSGAGNLRIIYRHIMPNIVPMALVYTAMNLSTAILTEASVSFLGYGDPLLVSWGKTLQMAYVAQAIYDAWWWVVPPGLAITLLVLSGFFISRAYEEIANPRLRQR